MESEGEEEMDFDICCDIQLSEREDQYEDNKSEQEEREASRSEEDA